MICLRYKMKKRAVRLFFSSYVVIDKVHLDRFSRSFRVFLFLYINHRKDTIKDDAEISQGLFFEIVSNTLSTIFYISNKFEVDQLAEVVPQIFDNLDCKVDHESRS